MKIEEFRSFFTEPDLQAKLWGDSPSTPKAKRGKDEIVTSLLQPTDSRERCMNLFVATITRNCSGERSQVKDAKKFVEKYMKQIKHLTEAQKAQLQEYTTQLAEIILKAKSLVQESVSAILQQPLPLSAMTQKAEELRKNECAGATAISHALNSWEHAANINYDAFRTGAKEGHNVNASDIATPLHNFIIAGLPRTILEAQSYLQAAIKQGCTLFISAHETHEGQNKRKISKFWEDEALSRMTFENGVTIIRTSVKTLATGDKGDRSTAPELIESSLLLSDGKRITHIHYTEWKDRTPCPDETLLMALHDRMAHLVLDAKSPIAINCHGGVGRSATIAASYFLRKHIDKELEAGKPLDEIALNIPQTITEFRQFRKHVVANPYHVASLYASAGRYHMQKAQEMHVFKSTELPADFSRLVAEYCR